MERTKLIIDTDAGDDIDDVLAIAFAARREEIDLLAVTTVTQDSRRRAALVRQVLDAAGRSDVPVAPGLQLPLRPTDAQGRAWWAREERMNHCPPGGSQEHVHTETAVDLLARLIEAHPEQITLVSIGPMTNIATLLCRRPDLAPKIKVIAAMGGEIELLRAEHNIKSDDIAADHVLRSGVPVFLGTWSVTRQVVVSAEDCERLAAHDTPLCRLIADCTKKWWPHRGWKPGPIMYDIAPIVWAFAPILVDTAPKHIAIETRSELTRGMTIPTPGDPNADVTTAINADTVHDMLMQTLLTT